MPDEALAGPDALEHAVAGGADWIWLLASNANPKADALERLLDAADPPGEPAAALLGGMVVGRSGVEVVSQLPRGDPHDLEAVVRLAGRRLLPLSYASSANSLVAADCLVRHGLPDEHSYGPYATIQWTARVLREETGYLVPTSVVVLGGQCDRRSAVAAIPALARMITAGVWTRGEALSNIQSCFRAMACGR